MLLDHSLFLFQLVTTAGTSVFATNATKQALSLNLVKNVICRLVYHIIILPFWCWVSRRNPEHYLFYVKLPPFLFTLYTLCTSALFPSFTWIIVGDLHVKKIVAM